eukprot:scaffold22575_cov141-Cylindrotheca_fusiformis.AAC.9
MLKILVVSLLDSSQKRYQNDKCILRTRSIEFQGTESRTNQHNSVTFFYFALSPKLEKERPFSSATIGGQSPLNHRRMTWRRSFSVDFSISSHCRVGTCFYVDVVSREASPTFSKPQKYQNCAILLTCLRIGPFSSVNGFVGASLFILPNDVSTGNVTRDSRLAVCEKCKKNFKTRDMCRVRNTHTSAPWTTAYICLTLDDSCTDSNGKYVDKPLTVRMVQWQPYCVREPFIPKTPVCAACKKTNRTRSFCRERHKHRQLPWCTVYVLLSALDSADPATVVAAPSKPVEEDTVRKEESNDNEANKDEESKASSPANAETEEKTDEVNDGDSTKKAPEKNGDWEGDDINDIAESRTFLAKVSCKSTSIHWLDLVESDGNDGSNVANMHLAQDPAMYGMGPGGPGMPVPPEHYYHPNLYASQQHQHALKLHQQYNFHMQRHPNQYPAPWPPHYNQNHHMIHGQPVSPPAAPGGPPRADGSPNGPPVTAGEAAAQQQKRNREMPDDRGQSPMHAPQGHPHGPPGGPHGQQHNWMIYQQMYQAQLPPMGLPQYHPPPGGRHMSPQEAGHGGEMGPGNEQSYNGPHSPNGKDPHESDSKRQRLE